MLEPFSTHLHECVIFRELLLDPRSRGVRAQTYYSYRKAHPFYRSVVITNTRRESDGVQKWSTRYCQRGLEEWGY